MALTSTVLHALHTTYFLGELKRVLGSLMAVDTGKENIYDYRSATAFDQ